MGNMNGFNDELTHHNSFFMVTDPFTPIDHVTEAINGREKEGINERPHSGLFEHMQAAVPILRGISTQEKNEEVDK